MSPVDPGARPDPGTGPEPQPARDPGLQPERTRLAWRRSMLAMTAIALLTARLGVQRGGIAGLLAIALAGAGWVAAVSLAFSRYGRPASGTSTSHPEPGGPALPLTALVVLGYAGLGLALVLLPAP